MTDARDELRRDSELARAIANVLRRDLVRHSPPADQAAAILWSGVLDNLRADTWDEGWNAAAYYFCRGAAEYVNPEDRPTPYRAAAAVDGSANHGGNDD